MKKKSHKGQVVNPSVVIRVESGASAIRCVVMVESENIALIFERHSSGIFCIDRERDGHGTTRASRNAFIAARRAAVKEMNQHYDDLTQRVRTAHLHITVTLSSVGETVVRYHGIDYSFCCDPEKPLKWENLLYVARFDTRVSDAQGTQPAPMHLEDAEMWALKRRAMAVILSRRLQAHYLDGGHGEPVRFAVRIGRKKLPPNPAQLELRLKD